MARWQFRPPIERVKDGFRINLDPDEKELVLRLVSEMRDLLMGPSDNPALTRVFPAAYHQAAHAEFDAEYQRLMREELVASRLAAMQQVGDALNSTDPLSEEAMHGLLQSLNAVRLVLGTVLDVSEEHDPDDVRDDDPMVGEHHLYQFLSYLLEVAVQAVSA